MKLDRSLLKKPHSELNEKAKQFFDEIKLLKRTDLTNKLSTVSLWEFGKSELCLWADVLDSIDEILQAACEKKTKESFALQCDVEKNGTLKHDVLAALKFTALLFEYSYTRSIYSSMEHLISLLESSDITIVVAVLNLLYVFSKRTNFLGRLPHQQRDSLLQRLCCIAESWGGKENGFSLSSCCLENSSPPKAATSLHFEFFTDETETNLELGQTSANRIHYVHVDNVDQINKCAGEIVDDILGVFKVPKDKQINLLMHVRLAQSFGNYDSRLQCVIARLLSLSVLIYSGMLQENSNLLYSGFIEECVETLQLPDISVYMDVKTEILKTLTSVIYLDRNPRLNTIIEATGASAYHGFLPSLVRGCIQTFIDGKTLLVSNNYVTALFSLLYHMAGYDNGAEALVSSALTESLLSLVNWTSCPVENITYLTRAVRIIDLITNVDTQVFQNYGGMHVFVSRLSYEIDICRKEQPNQIDPPRKQSNVTGTEIHELDFMETDPSSSVAASSSSQPISPAPIVEETVQRQVTGVQCCSQRVVLIKSLLNFVKKAISDPQFSENVRHIMDGSLPAALRHIISNPDYYGSMLFLLAITVVTVFINQEPSQLTSLQDKGLTDVVMHALLVKDVPASREVLGHLPQAFSALCLNERGLRAFMDCNPFEKLFKVLLSTKYLNAMRRRRNSDPLGDTAMSLGTAIDELMRHQPTLKPTAMNAVIKLLEELCALGSDAKYSCVSKSNWRTPSGGQLADGVASAAGGQQANNSGETSDEDEEDEDSDSRQAIDIGDGSPVRIVTNEVSMPVDPKSRIAIPLVEYVQNVMKFIEAILSNNSTDDHARLFIQLNGLHPLIKLLALPNLPPDFGVSTACHSIAGVIRYLLTLTRDTRVLDLILNQLNEHCLKGVAPLTDSLTENANRLILVEDLLKYPICGGEDVPNTHLLQALGSLLSHLVVLSHVSRLGTSQNELKTMILQSWCDKGSKMLYDLHDLYRVIVWESTSMLALCSTDCSVGASDLFGNELLKSLQNRGAQISPEQQTEEPAANAVDLASAMDIDETNALATAAPSKEKTSPVVVNQLKPLIAMSSRIGRHLSELFVLLTRVSVGGATRSRRGQAPYQLPPSATGITLIEHILTNFRTVIEWQPTTLDASSTKLWFTYLVCAIGYLSQLLFDDRRQAYHLVLLKFYSSGTQKAYFRIFERLLAMIQSVSTKPNEFPDGCSEFLEAWLSLVEKLLNTQCVMESSHHFYDPSGNGKMAFSAVHYLAATQKMAFDHIMTLWSKLTSVNNRVSESILAILCHIIRSEKIIQKELKSEKDPTEKKEREDEHTDQINPQQLQQLIDMGFSREVAIEALMNASSVEQAAEICVSMPMRNLRTAPLAANFTPFGALDEEEQIQQAIALSLSGETTETTTDAQPSASGINILPTTTTTPSTNEPPILSSKISANFVVPLEDQSPLDPDTLQKFFDRDLLACCFQLIDTSSDLVYRVADLLSVVVKRSGDDWTNNLFANLRSEILLASNSLLSNFGKDESNMSEVAKLLIDSKPAVCLAPRLHLFCLLFEEFKQLCGLVISKEGMLPTLVKLLSEASHCLACVNDPKLKIPRWMAPLLLCLDAYDRESGNLKERRKIETMDKILWKYWDNRNWTNFTPASVNKQLTDAFKSGLRTIKFTINRRRYMVDFSLMVQINLDSGYQRPIVMFPSSSDAAAVVDSGVDPKESEKAMNKVTEKKSLNDMYTELPSLKDTERSAIVKATVDLIEVPVDADTLHAALRLCLRITRNYSFALEFLGLGGVKKLLRLRQSQSFTGLPIIVSLLIRHIMEDDAVLRHTIERVVRTVAQGGVATPDSSGNPEELYYVLRLLGPVACRDKGVFMDVVQKVLRIKVPPPRRSDDDEAALLNGNLPVDVRVEGVLQNHPALGDAAKEVLSRLLDYLTHKHECEPPKEGPEGKISAGSSTSAFAEPKKYAECLKPTTAKDAATTASSSTDPFSDENIKTKQPLVQKSAVLKLIAELIRSYSAVASVVTEYRYTPDNGELITEDCSALAFLLDNLLLENPLIGDAECSQGVRAIVATLAAANHCEEAQSSIVSEVKAALQRALNLNESQEKHNRICAIVALTTLMKDSCPNIQLTPAASAKAPAPTTPAPVRTNNIMKWIVKKKLVLDLARIPHSLDLSSPSAVSTINAVLKPLEELTRLINAPNTTLLSTPKNKSSARSQVSNNLLNGPTGIDNQESFAASNNNHVVAENPTNQAASVVENRNENRTSSDDSRPVFVDTINASDSERSRPNDTISDGEQLDQSGILSQQSMFGVMQEPDRFDDRVAAADQSAVSAVSLSTDSESSHDTTSSDDESQTADEAEEEAGGGVQDDGNEHGSEQDDEASEYEDVDDEVMDNEHEDIDDEDMSDFDENADMQIHLQANSQEGADPFGLLNDVLRDALSGRTEQNRDYVTTRGGSGLSIPDVEQFLAVAPEPTILQPSNLGMLGTTHPLLIRHADSPSAASTTHPGSSIFQNTQSFTHGSRTRYHAQRPVTSGLLRQGAVRHRTYRYVVNAQPNNNSPAILQRLLGPGIAQELLQLTQQMPNNPPGTARFVITEDDLRDSGFYDELETSTNGRLSVLTSIPNAYLRWTDECRILDGDAVHYILANLRPEIVQELEKHRNVEFDSRREKRKQMAEDEQKRKQTVEEEQKKNANAEQAANVLPVATVETQPNVAPALATVDVIPAETQNELNHSADEARLPPSPAPETAAAVTTEELFQLQVLSDTLSDVSQAPQTIETNILTPIAAPTAVETAEIVTSIPVNQDNPVSPVEENETDRGVADEGESLFPEGVDPAFLEALPENIRQEVIADQLRLQRLRQQNRQAASRPTAQNIEAAGPSAAAEVSPEFLAALPPELQDEVLAQQRLAQQQNRPPTSDTPFDPAVFMETLPPALRQQVLADADDSQFALLPPQFAAEARRLRTQLEQQQAVRFAAMSRQFPFMNLLNRRGETGFGGRYAVRAAPRRQQNATDSSAFLSSNHSSYAAATNATSARGQQLLDKEAITSLLVLFFMDDSRLNVGRLHRILKSLCYHQATRDWIVRALLSILEKTREHVDVAKFGSSAGNLSETVKSEDNKVVCGLKKSTQNWLNLTLNSSVGARVDVFELQRQHSSGKKTHWPHTSTIQVHPQAAPAVCRHVMDTLISLAKSFPTQFLPSDSVVASREATESPLKSTPSVEEDGAVGGAQNLNKSATTTSDPLKTDFWDILLRLDNTSTNTTRKPSKVIVKTHSSTQIDQARYTNLDESPLGHVMSMLKHPVIANNQSLMDRILRLLSLVVSVFPASASESFDKLSKDANLIPKTESSAIAKEEKPCLELQLSALVEVVTRGQCSEEGLEDGRGVVLQIARCLGGSTRAAVFRALIKAAQELGAELRDQIKNLLDEISTLQYVKESDQPGTSSSNEWMGPKSLSRTPTSTPILPISGVQKPLVQSATSKELQLPAMSALTKKTSVQQCLLRTLNTILMLRDAKRLKESESRTVNDVQSQPAEPNAQRTNVDNDQNLVTIESTVPAPVDPSTTTSSPATAMEIDENGCRKVSATNDVDDSPLSSLISLNDLWDFLGECLRRLTEASDPHAVLVLQPAVEAFFMVHAGSRREKQKSGSRAGESVRVDVGRHESGSADVPPASPAMAESFTGSFPHDAAANATTAGGTAQDLSPDTKKFVKFAEEHRTVLNQILRQSTQHLADGPFAILVDYTRILDFDVKRRYFRKELERGDDGFRREDCAVRVRRDHVFQDSFRELFRLRPNEWKSRFYIIFEGEEGQDAGGLLREWFSIITREIFNPNYALFGTSPGDRVTYMINASSYVNIEHLDYFKFVGRLIAKAVYDNKLLDCFFTRAFYKHILSKNVRYNDLESEDPSFYQSLCFLLEHPVDQIGNDLTFSLEVSEFGVYEVRDLKPNGRNILVTDENKVEYVRLVCQMKMTGAIRQQLNAFLTGFYDIIPRHLIGIFNEQELELLISGLPNIDIDDLQANTEYHKYVKNSLQIQWFWRALRAFDQADRAKFLQFVTGTSKVPLQGFSALEGMHGIQRFQIHRDDRSTERLPTAHTCFNQLDLPVYETYDKLKDMLLLAIRECTEGFGFA